MLRLGSSGSTEYGVQGSLVSRRAKEGVDMEALAGDTCCMLPAFAVILLGPTLLGHTLHLPKVHSWENKYLESGMR